jgi:glycerophosphoryl diester phosphodiesterase
MPAPAEVVAAIHSRGKELVVWCPPLSRVRALAAAGVDALIVDDVERHVRALHGAPHLQEARA